MKAEMNIVREYLESRFFHTFSVGTSYGLHFEKSVLIAQEILIEHGDRIDTAISNVFPEIKETVDRPDVAVSAVIAATKYIPVSDVSLGEDSNLLLTFRNGVKLTFPTNTEIVDWQWALTRSGGCPYTASEFIAGVFFDTLEAQKKT